ncbi:HGGxSTG domain-containing protein [Paracoccus thiocyanatus]|uniref:Uncharacterized protein n=1 Tax=Paracoccus thiocyanatus TaxID=34006 RepID=A0A3D8P9A9_9RHOB|nr:HGGxSTG domain-containing protein [Paracoccus thiocyanatus]RDW12643.1 hypothetical protein DIE28_12575 [Paracoccus thiocyanatus]
MSVHDQEGFTQVDVSLSLLAHGSGICGARTRKGTPCKCRAMNGKTRCRFHGGCSTGPKTTEGRARIAIAQHHRWFAWRSHRASQAKGGCPHSERRHGQWPEVGGPDAPSVLKNNQGNQEP